MTGSITQAGPDLTAKGFHVTFSLRPALRNKLREPIATLLLYSIFAATGAAIVMPGTLLPSFLIRWSLNDAQTGLLFFCFFLGSSLGALLARGRLAWSIVRGCVVSSAAIGMLAVSSRVSAFMVMLLFGVGLGIAMTSVSLFQSRRRPGVRFAEMTRLNLIWAFGAATGPALLLGGFERTNLTSVLLAATAVLFLGGLLAVWILPDNEPPEPSFELPSSAVPLHQIPWTLLAMVPLATGVESSVGAWLTTYSRRGGMMLTATISTVTCFWLGLLLSRLIQSIAGVAAKFHREIVRSAPLLMIAGNLLLVFPKGQVMVAGGALLAGIGVGPLYPLVLGLMLNRGEMRNLMFLAAGIGSSTLPLLTGLLADRTGSLAVGLAVPLTASVVMLLLALRVETSNRKA